MATAKGMGLFQLRISCSMPVWRGTIITPVRRAPFTGWRQATFRIPVS
jgi:hypothetical protein